MPRQARLDFPGTLHHVILRGIEGREIVDSALSPLGCDVLAYVHLHPGSGRLLRAP